MLAAWLASKGSLCCPCRPASSGMQRGRQPVRSHRCGHTRAYARQVALLRVRLSAQEPATYTYYLSAHTTHEYRSQLSIGKRCNETSQCAVAPRDDQETHCSLGVCWVSESRAMDGQVGAAMSLLQQQLSRSHACRWKWKSPSHAVESKGGHDTSNDFWGGWCPAYV